MVGAGFIKPTYLLIDGGDVDGFWQSLTNIFQMLTTLVQPMFL
jgi:hypothetical protein